MDLDLETKKELYTVKYYQIRMMNNQQYNTLYEDELDHFKHFEKDGMFQKFIDHYSTEMKERELTNFYDSLSMTYTSNDLTMDVQKQCYYIPRSKGKTGEVNISQIKEMLKNVKIKMIIIISPHRIGSQALSYLNDKADQGYRFIPFIFNELMYDPLDSYLVPPHEILGRKDSRLFLKETGLSINDLPRIKENDPIIKRLDGRAGQIVKITRNVYFTDSLVKNSIFYRFIVPPPLIESE